MHGHVRFEGNPPTAHYHKRFLTSLEEIVPVPDLNELWYKQQSGKKPLKMTVTFEDDTNFSVILRKQFGQIHVSAEDLPQGLTSEDVTRYLGSTFAYIPGLVGVLVEEPFATTARRISLATQGRYSEIFRSSLFQLKERDANAIEKINQWLDNLFGVEVTTISFDMEKDEFVTIKYLQEDAKYDVVSSGSGLQQIIQVLTYLYLTKPKYLLIDEPDAHLHSSLQARLGDLFQKVASDLNAQLFISTHSLDLIDSFSTEQVLLVNSTKKNIRSLGSDSDLIEAMVKAGVVDISSISRILTSKRIVVIEDKDQSILKAIDKSLGNLLFPSKSPCYVLSSMGASNFPAVAEIGKVLSVLSASKIKITFIQDRDGMPDFIVENFRKSQEKHGIKVKLLGRHEIESYLIEPSLIRKAAKRADHIISTKSIEKAILAAANSLRAEAQRMCLLTARNINRRLPKKLGKYKDKELEIKVYEWFDQLDLTSLNVVRNVFPGKELLKRTLINLNNKYNIGLTREKLVAALIKKHIASDLQDMIIKLTKE